MSPDIRFVACCFEREEARTGQKPQRSSHELRGFENAVTQSIIEEDRKMGTPASDASAPQCDEATSVADLQNVTADSLTFQELRAEGSPADRRLIYFFSYACPLSATGEQLSRLRARSGRVSR